MEVERKTVEVVTYRSSKVPKVETQNPELAKVIEWADAHPVAWAIVTGTKSKAFGRNSCEYIGWAQGNNSPAAILERAQHFYQCLFGKDYRSQGIWGWRANFTFTRFGQEGFNGGYFSLWDGRYDRSTMSLDYTPETMDEVIEKFLGWCDRHFDQVAVKLDGEIIKELKHGEA